MGHTRVEQGSAENTLEIHSLAAALCERRARKVNNTAELSHHRIIRDECEAAKHIAASAVRNSLMKIVSSQEKMPYFVDTGEMKAPPSSEASLQTRRTSLRLECHTT